MEDARHHHPLGPRLSHRPPLRPLGAQGRASHDAHVPLARPGHLGGPRRGSLYDVSWYKQADFLYTVLFVAFNFSVADATRIASVYSFCAVVGGVSLGQVIKKVRRLKPFVVGSIGLWLLAYGLLVHYRGGAASNARSGLIAGQILPGLAGGFFPYPNLAAAQALTKHEDIAVITSIMLTMNNVGRRSETRYREPPGRRLSTSDCRKIWHPIRSSPSRCMPRRCISFLITPSARLSVPPLSRVIGISSVC